MNLSERIGRFLSDVLFLMGGGENSRSSTIGARVYEGRVNRHVVTIKADPSQVYRALVDFSEMQRWCPREKITVEKITAGKLGPGTRMRYRLNYRINPIWHSIVVDMEENRRIINRFVDGIFEGSVEVWQLEEVERETELSHTLIYRINKLILRLGWIFLGGQAKHNELTEEALHNLKTMVEGKSRSSMSAQ
jgi:uncharacterized protein YndB with AHSA1/START domain